MEPNVNIAGSLPVLPPQMEAKVSQKSSPTDPFNDLDFLTKTQGLGCPNKTKGSEDDNLLLVLDERNKSSRLEDNSLNSNIIGPGGDYLQSSPSVKPDKPDSSPLVAHNFPLSSVKEIDLDNIDLLENIKPMELTLSDETNMEDKVSFTLTFGRLSEFPDFVWIAVFTLTNRNSSSSLLNYVFQLLPPKGFQVCL